MGNMRASQENSSSTACSTGKAAATAGYVVPQNRCPICTLPLPCHAHARKLPQIGGGTSDRVPSSAATSLSEPLVQPTCDPDASRAPSCKVIPADSGTKKPEGSADDHLAESSSAQTLGRNQSAEYSNDHAANEVSTG